MPRAKISDAHGITIELEAGEASYEQLGDKALELLAAALVLVDQRPTGSGNGLQADRRGEPTMGFGTQRVQPGRWIGYHNETDGILEP